MIDPGFQLSQFMVSKKVMQGIESLDLKFYPFTFIFGVQNKINVEWGAHVEANVNCQSAV